MCRFVAGDALPLKSNPRSASLTKRQAIDDALDKLIATGVARCSEGPWSSPVVLVPKKNGSSRLCADYRRMTDMTRKDAYPLPSIDSVLSTLGEVQYFSKLLHLLL